MDEIAVRRHEALQAMANMEFRPVPVEKENSLSSYTKISLSKISTIGVAFEPLASAIQNVFGSGGATSGLYRVTVPSGTHLAEFKNGAGNLGTVLNVNNQISGQAVLNPLVCNPTMLFMAAALAGIDKKLDNIQETQQEMLDFLVQKEKSELKGDLKFLGDILDHYKYNWNSDKYKAGNYIKVLDIRQGAERKLNFYREQITAHLNQKSILHSDQVVQKQLDKVTDEFANYQLALYVHAFSSFLEVMLQENFDEAYLDAVSQKIEAHSFQYRELYTKCYEQIDSYESLLLQRRNILPHRVGAHLHRFANGFVAGPTLVGFPVLDGEQVAVDGDFTGFQSEMINLIGNREVVFNWVALGPSVELQIASPLFFLPHSLSAFVIMFSHPFSLRLILLFLSGTMSVA